MSRLLSHTLRSRQDLFAQTKHAVRGSSQPADPSLESLSLTRGGSHVWVQRVNEITEKGAAHVKTN